MRLGDFSLGPVKFGFDALQIMDQIMGVIRIRDSDIST